MGRKHCHDFGHDPTEFPLNERSLRCSSLYNYVLTTVRTRTLSSLRSGLLACSYDSWWFVFSNVSTFDFETTFWKSTSKRGSPYKILPTQPSTISSCWVPIRWTRDSCQFTRSQTVLVIQSLLRYSFLPRMYIFLYKSQGTLLEPVQTTLSTGNRSPKSCVETEHLVSYFWIYSLDFITSLPAVFLVYKFRMTDISLPSTSLHFD